MTRRQKIKGQLLRQFVRMMSPRHRRILAFRLMEESGVASITFEREGLTWSASAYELISWQLFVEGGHHREEMRALIAWLHRNGVLTSLRNVVIDAGANVGTTCITLAREAGCRALAIEPVDVNFSRLQTNVETNALSHRIALAKKAIATKPGSLTMCITKGNSGSHFVVRDGNDFPEEKIAGYQRVEADTLSCIVAEAGFKSWEIALVWADVQGCEMDVIESGKPLWERGIPLWAEVEPVSLRRQGALSTFASTAATHFDRFIDARSLVRVGDGAKPSPITELPRLIQGITPEQAAADILLLPPA